MDAVIFILPTNGWYAIKAGSEKGLKNYKGMENSYEMIENTGRDE